MEKYDADRPYVSRKIIDRTSNREKAELASLEKALNVTLLTDRERSKVEQLKTEK